MSSARIAEKRVCDDVEAEIECSVAKKAKVDVELHPTHPFAILDHLVKNVLPVKCTNEKIKQIHQQQLDDPEATIVECKQYLADWVIDLWKRRRTPAWSAQAYVV